MALINGMIKGEVSENKSIEDNAPSDVRITAW